MIIQIEKAFIKYENKLLDYQNCDLKLLFACYKYVWINLNF